MEMAAVEPGNEFGDDEPGDRRYRNDELFFDTDADGTFKGLGITRDSSRPSCQAATRRLPKTPPRHRTERDPQENHRPLAAHSEAGE